MNAAVIVCETVPSGDEMEELAEIHLQDFLDDDQTDATATFDIVDVAPDFLSCWEQDQFNAYLRDGAECLLVIYMSAGCPESFDD